VVPAEGALDVALRASEPGQKLGVFEVGDRDVAFSVEGRTALMGRELRRVPGDWQHPKTEQGLWIPMHEWWGRDEDAIAEGLRAPYAHLKHPPGLELK
jgi:hypothetical protein